MAAAHLNGSLNLPSAEEVFRTVGSIAGDSVDKIPDGETGERQGWIAALIPKLRDVPQLEARQLQAGYDVKMEFTLRDGVDGEEIDVPELGYAEAARHAYPLADTAQLVAVANAVTERAARPLHWFSMPVPIGRDDDSYYEPLSDLKLHDSARLYLGLIHHQDGVEGTQCRIDTAKRHVDGFGVAAECGMGRKASELVPRLLEIQA